MDPCVYRDMSSLVPNDILVLSIVVVLCLNTEKPSYLHLSLHDKYFFLSLCFRTKSGKSDFSFWFLCQKISIVDPHPVIVTKGDLTCSHLHYWMTKLSFHGTPKVWSLFFVPPWFVDMWSQENQDTVVSKNRDQTHKVDAQKCSSRILKIT